MDTTVREHNESNEAIAQHVVEKAYDKIALTYQSLYSVHPTSTRIRYCQTLADALQPQATLLELGCGGGIGSQLFANRGFQITGVDISKAQIELAREHLPNATLIHADMLSLDFAPASFDAIVAMYSILHLPKSDQEVMVKRMSKWLRNGGYVLCNLPADEAAVYETKWLGAEMFFESLGLEGNRKMFEEQANELHIVQEEVVVDENSEEIADATGAREEKWHWIFAIKQSTVPQEVLQTGL